jgi:hypothetical protein
LLEISEHCKIAAKTMISTLMPFPSFQESDSGCCTRTSLAFGAFIVASCFSAKRHYFEVEPRGFEPLTSAVQRRIGMF